MKENQPPLGNGSQKTSSTHTSNELQPHEQATDKHEDQDSLGRRKWIKLFAGGAGSILALGSSTSAWGHPPARPNATSRIGQAKLPVQQQISAGFTHIKALRQQVDDGNKPKFEVSVTSSQTPAPLPVELISFEVISVSLNAVQLRWKTAAEINNAGFYLERSLDGTSFEQIVWMLPALNTTDGQREYTYSDSSLELPVPHYYRLRQVDYDGTTTLSQVLVVTPEIPDVVGIAYMRPSVIYGPTVEIGLQNGRSKAVEVELRILDQSGRLASVGSSTLTPESSASIILDVSSLAAGTYVLQLLAKGQTPFARQILVTR